MGGLRARRLSGADPYVLSLLASVDADRATVLTESARAAGCLRLRRRAAWVMLSIGSGACAYWAGSHGSRARGSFVQRIRRTIRRNWPAMSTRDETPLTASAPLATID